MAVISKERSSVDKALTWNVNGMRTRSKIFRIHAIIKNIFENPYIICFQEVHLAFSDKYIVRFIRKIFKEYTLYLSFGTRRSCGVILMIRKDFRFKVLHEFNDHSGRFVLLKGLINGQSFSISSMYAPCDAVHKRQEFFNRFLIHDIGHNFLLMGDFNSVLNKQLDRVQHGCRQVEPLPNQELYNFTQNCHATEIWRYLHPSEKQWSYTRTNRANNNVWSRLDFAFFPTALMGQIRGAEYSSNFNLSDHKPLVVQIDFGSAMLGNDFKKIKPYVYSTEDFDTDFRSLWGRIRDSFSFSYNHTLSEGMQNPDINESFEDILEKSELISQLNIDPLWWENVKCKTRDLGLKTQKKCVKAKYEEHRRLIFELSKASDSVHRGQIEKQLDVLAQSAYKKEFADSKEFHCFKNEKFSKEYYQLFSNEKSDMYIADIPNDDGILLKTLEDKKSYVWNKCNDLYNIQFDAFSQVDTFGQPMSPEEIYEIFACKITTDVHTFQDTSRITLEEVKSAVSRTLNEKCPGIDGLAIEFYKKYFSIVGPFLTGVFNHVFEFGITPKSWKTSILKLIPKKNRDPKFDNLRPLQLGVVDCKLYASIIASRIELIMQNCIGPFQTGGLPHRNIIQNITLVHLIITFCSMRKIPGFIFSIDFRKAFDRINRAFMFYCLKRYGVAIKLVNAIENLYRDNFCQILINGFLTEPFPVNNGVRQGCPLSAMLYVATVEPLSIAVEKEKSIQAFSLPRGCEVKMVQHMDDTTFILQNTDAIERILEVIKAFNLSAGSQLNLGKCKIIEVNSTHVDKKLHDIKFLNPHEFHDMLGVKIGPNIDLYVPANWDKVVGDASTFTERWHMEDISILGRANLVLSKIFSKVEFKLSILQCPQKYVKLINDIIYSFMNKGKANIPLETLCLPKSQGGLGVPHLVDRAAALRLRIMQACYFEEKFDFQYDPANWPLQHDDEGNIIGSDHNEGLRIVCNLIQYFLGQTLDSIQWREGRSLDSVQMHRHLGNGPHFGTGIDLNTDNIAPLYFSQFAGFLKSFVDFKASQELKGMSVKEYYKLLRKKAISDTNFCNPIPYVLDEAQVKKAWKNLFQPHLDHNIVALNYKLMHDAIPNRVKLCRVNLNRLDNFAMRRVQCQFCIRKEYKPDGVFPLETNQHIFIDCPIAEQTWEFIKNAMIAHGHIIYGHEISLHGAIFIAKSKLFYKFDASPLEADFIQLVIMILWWNRCINDKQHQAQDHKFVIKRLIEKLIVFKDTEKRKLSSSKYIAKWTECSIALTALQTYPLN